MGRSKKTTVETIPATNVKFSEAALEKLEVIREEAKKEADMTELLSLHPYIVELGINAKTGEPVKMFGRSPNLPALRTYVDKYTGEWCVADKNVFVDGHRTDAVKTSEVVQTLWADKDGAIYVVTFDQRIRENEKEGTSFSYLKRDINRLLKQAHMKLPEAPVYEDGVQVDMQAPSLLTEKGCKAGLALLKSRPDIYYNFLRKPYKSGFTYEPCKAAPEEREMLSDEGAI